MDNVCRIDMKALVPKHKEIRGLLLEITAEAGMTKE
jgi:hypothetical protein